MEEKGKIRGPDPEKAPADRQELRKEIQVMIIFTELIRQDMKNFMQTGKAPPEIVFWKR